jgi:hypothetical protein
MRPKVFRLHYYTKVGSRDRGLVAEGGLLELLTDINHGLCEAKSGASYGGLPNDRLIYRFKWASAVAAANYKMGDAKKRTDWTNMIWSWFATERTLNSDNPYYLSLIFILFRFFRFNLLLMPYILLLIINNYT